MILLNCHKIRIHRYIYLDITPITLGDKYFFLAILGNVIIINRCLI